MPDPFTTLPLRPELLEALSQVGYTEMTPIQAQALPPMLDQGDVTGQAKTGSGKTAAFGLALLNRLDSGMTAPQALVLCPTPRASGAGGRRTPPSGPADGQHACAHALWRATKEEPARVAQTRVSGDRRHAGKGVGSRNPRHPPTSTN